MNIRCNMSKKWTTCVQVRHKPKEHKEKTLQRFADMQNQANHKHPDDQNADVAEPDPDYLFDDDVSADSFPPPPSPLSLDGGDGVPQNGQSFHLHTPHPRAPSLTEAESAESLIRPKKLANPCVDSRDRQALHRELLLNYKLGKNVLQKPELSRKMLDRRQTQKKKEWEEQMNNKRTSFELKMEERATRLKEEEQKSMTTISETSGGPELMRMHAKITHKE
ncbi:protein FAM107B-like isoform X6 [Haliotis rufescens]|uniref:protein FAM107B-like isoform X6 n=1 Tax=Haliotis rufescens TaxID=6454 RepID=UPI001EAFC944|nr:protein FAM107B-like isoform X6 [Haliotis rufescens]